MGVVSQLYLESSNNTHYVPLKYKKTTTRIDLILLSNIIYYVSSICHLGIYRNFEESSLINMTVSA